MLSIFEIAWTVGGCEVARRIDVAAYQSRLHSGTEKPLRASLRPADGNPRDLAIF